MILQILILPLLTLLVIGTLGRYLGNKGTFLIVILNFSLILLLSIYYLIEILLDGNIITLTIGSESIYKYENISYLYNNTKFLQSSIFNNESLLNISLTKFLFDDLSIIMLIVVLSITIIVLLYTYDYMINDPHFIRFYFYIILFVFFMIILITTSSLPILFIGQEGVGLSSFLLISFQFTRFQAQLGALLAIIMNRIGDVFFLLGIFLCLTQLGSIDIITLFSHANENLDIILISFFIAAMAKSAQIYLHLQLPYSMEGQNKNNGNIIIFSKINPFTGVYTPNFNLYTINPIIKRNFSNSSNLLIKNTSLLNNIRSNTVITQYQKKAIIGLLISDGHIKKKSLEMTLKTSDLEFIKQLKFNILGSISSKVEPSGYPKNNPTQYQFSTLSHPYIESLKYKQYIPKKIIPEDLYSEFTEVTLAFMIMGDGYQDNDARTVFICTESFRLEDVNRLLYILRIKFNLVVTTKKRKNGFRIRFSSREKNLRLLRSLVYSHFHSSMLYKLGPCI